ncbi:MAG: hypothetical protein K2I81_01965 [Alphaproteobacteria bacterium]|nr:hypothetical protein [Alphaproteobacteria bacterium]
MSFCYAQIFKVSFIVASLLAGGDAFAAQAPNPRGGTASNTTTASARTDGRDVQRAATTTTAASAVSRSATRRPTTTVSRAAAVSGKTVATGVGVSARSATATPRSGTVTATPTASHATVGRAASSNVVRAATSSSVARSATSANVSRAASARATAVFDDISAIGGGYAACREAYATCMDQFCANANDTYRRCYCSSKFTEFRDTEYALEQAKTLLMQFEDNNLNAVDKTAAEVNAMYSATVGELAIKKDTSAAANTLNEIGDLLSGKKKASTSSGSTTSLGIMSFDFTDDVDDIWSGGGSSIFNTSSGEDLSQLEGQKLYDSANSQCLKIISESCENNAVLTMARSAYNILITQDCNAYEKKVNSQREAVKQTVRQAEKILRDARLEEYRAHNSADVNECLDKVRTALTQDTACGANYKRCLDYSGVYIDQNTGEPIYSPRLFQLVEQINLDGSADVLGRNAQFNQFLDSKKMFATTALDSCRDISDIVWNEFKRTALIEIAQAQDAKIEEVKMSCVSTMADCYDTQSNALKSFDNTTSQYAGATAAYAARAMCQDKVAACAALYAGAGDVQCQFDSNGRLTNGATCGLTALVSFVQTVDDVRVAEGCATALENKLKDTCTPQKGDRGYPWNCRGMSREELTTTVRGYAQMYCADPTSQTLAAETETTVNKAINDLYEELDYQLMEACEDIDGYWIEADGVMQDNLSGTLLTAFYANYFGGRSDANKELSWGRCVQNDTQIQCLNYNTDAENPVAQYDRNRDECIFSEAWYKSQCEGPMGGYYENSVCYVAK